jgi:glycosyltransferase involved in cell wall biosynthesis
LERWKLLIKSWPGIIRGKQSKAKTVCDIAVVIALYNQGQYIAESVKSVFDNTWLPAEVVIVDDCSTDDSAVKAFETVMEYESKLPNIKLIKNDVNKHLAGARNVGILATRSPWLVCLDSDDRLELNYFEQMAAWQRLQRLIYFTQTRSYLGARKGKYSFQTLTD